MSLTNVWIDTAADGLIRADTVIGIGTHRTPAISGKPSRWLIDVVLPAPTGSGLGDSWSAGPLHRTLAQTDHPPADAPPQLARLLAQLDATNAAGIITTTHDEPDTSNVRDGADDGQYNSASTRFRFTPFPIPQPGRHYDTDYL
jgi:hypothetical protein